MKLFRGILRTLFILIILFALVYFTFYLRQLKLNNQSLTNQVMQLQQSQAALVSQQLHFEATQESSASLAWMHAKAFILDAQAVLVFRQNPMQTAQLLQLAQQQISNIDGDKFVLLNTAISQDLVTMSTLPNVNVTSIVQSIDAINAQIDQVPVLAPVQNLVSVSTAPAPLTQSEWRKIWRMLKTEFKSLFVVERTDTSFEGLVSVQDHTMMKTYVKTLLLQASYAAIEKNNVVYQASLQQALVFLNTYYLPHTLLVNTIITQINTLAATNVAPTLPTQLRSATLIEAAQ